MIDSHTAECWGGVSDGNIQTLVFNILLKDFNYFVGFEEINSFEKLDVICVNLRVLRSSLFQLVCILFFNF